MAAVESPSAAEIISYTGLTQFVRGEDSADFAEWLESLVPAAAAELQVLVDARAGDGTYDGDWTDSKALLIKKGIAYLVAAAALMDPALKVATGTNEPYIIEDSEAIAAMADRFQEKGEALAGLVSTGRAPKPGYTRPRARSSGITPATTDRTPSERLALINEADDVSSFDTTNG